MRKMIVWISVALILILLLQFPVWRSEEEFLPGSILAGESMMLPESLEYPGGEDLQLRLARWYNLNLCSDLPDAGFRDAYPVLLQSDTGCMGYLVLANGRLTYPFFQEQSTAEIGFVHDSLSSYPISTRGERTVLWWCGNSDSPESVLELFGLMPGDCVMLYILDRELTYIVLPEGEKQDDASRLELVFPLEDGETAVIYCKCLESAFYP